MAPAILTHELLAFVGYSLQVPKNRTQTLVLSTESTDLLPEKDYCVRVGQFVFVIAKRNPCVKIAQGN